ncbi:MAG: hypothetical protein PCFJNLEI_03764 [Verrucomicrobiae bacterium]|nr:hypothetical protein [Verrucomicrobiae bacterium]
MFNKNLAICLGAALFLRLAFIFLGFPFLQERWQLREDGDGYRPIAETILTSRYSDVTRGPVYPFIVAACPGVSLKVVQAVLDTAVCALVFWLSGRRVWAAWLWAVYPFAIWRVAFVNKEIVLTFLLLAYVCVQVRAWRLDCWRERLTAGVLLGLVNLCKPMFLLWPVVLLVVAPRRAWLTLVAMVVVLAPWTGRNWWVTGGEFLPVATERGGVTTFIGNFQPTLGLWEGPNKPQWQAAVEEINAVNAALAPVKLDRVFYRAAFEQVLANPVKALELAVRKCWRFWFLSAKQREQALSFAIQGGYLLLLGIGLYRGRPWDGVTRLGLGVIGYVLAVHAMSYADLRFSLIVMPVVCVLAGRKNSGAGAPATVSVAGN